MQANHAIAPLVTKYALSLLRGEDEEIRARGLFIIRCCQHVKSLTLCIHAAIALQVGSLCEHGALAEPIVELLLADTERRHRLLSLNALEEHEAPVLQVWHPLTMVQTVISMVERADLDTFTNGHVEVIYAAVASQEFKECELAEKSKRCALELTIVAVELDDWIKVFNRIRDFVLVSLCEEKEAERAAFVLEQFFYHEHLRTSAVSVFAAEKPNKEAPKAPPFFAVIKAAFGLGGNDKSRSVIFSLLKDLISIEDQLFIPHIYAILKVHF